LSLLVIIGLVVLSISVLERRVRGRRGGHVTPPIVTADHVSKWYGQVIGLNDVRRQRAARNHRAARPNGAGKSTFMKLITGQLNPSKGSVKVLGEADLAQPAPVFPDPASAPSRMRFYERMTGLEWVTALVRLNGLSDKEADEAARRALATVDLMDAAGKKIGAYSKGMRQRVKLAQAIVHDPQLLILDEPLSGMDPLARRKTIRLIREWARSGKSVIVSSHILHEIESMTANILLINNGRILAEGDVHHIRDPHRRASAYGVRPGGESAGGGAGLPRPRGRAQHEVRGGRGGRRDRQAGCVLRAADRDCRERRVRW
jgi:ABC-2 type transport system ATP-binding protein